MSSLSPARRPVPGDLTRLSPPTARDGAGPQWTGDHPVRVDHPGTVRTLGGRLVRSTGRTEPVLISRPAEVRGAPRIHRPGIQGLGA